MRAYFIDNNDNVLGLGQYVTSAKVTQDLGQYDTLSLELGRNAYNDDLVNRASQIGVMVNGQYELFSLLNPQKKGNYIEITAVESFSDILAFGAPVKATKFTNTTFMEPLHYALNGLGIVINTYPDAPTDYTNTIKLDNCTPQQALDSVKQAYGLEINWHVSIDGTRVTGRYCDVHKQIGQNTSTRLVAGKNVSEMAYSIDTSKIYTAVVGYGGQPQKDDSQKVSSSESYEDRLSNNDYAGENDDYSGFSGNYTNMLDYGILDSDDDLETLDDDSDDTSTQEQPPIDFSAAVWSTANGDPVDKPAGSNMLEFKELTQRYGINYNGYLHPRVAIKTFSDDTNPYTLLKDCYEWLLANSSPQVQVQATALETDNLGLGDRVTAVDYTAGITAIRARVTHVEHDLLDETNTQLTIGTNTWSMPQVYREKVTKQQVKHALQKEHKLTEKKIKPIKEKQEKQEKELKDIDDDLKDKDAKIKDAKDKALKAGKDLNDYKATNDNALKGVKDTADNALNNSKDGRDALNKANKNASDIKDLRNKITQGGGGITNLDGYTIRDKTGDDSDTVLLSHNAVELYVPGEGAGVNRITLQAHDPVDHTVSIEIVGNGKDGIKIEPDGVYDTNYKSRTGTHDNNTPLPANGVMSQDSTDDPYNIRADQYITKGQFLDMISNLIDHGGTSNRPNDDSTAGANTGVADLEQQGHLVTAYNILSGFQVDNGETLEQYIDNKIWDAIQANNDSLNAGKSQPE